MGSTQKMRLLPQLGCWSFTSLTCRDCLTYLVGLCWRMKMTKTCHQNSYPVYGTPAPDSICSTPDVSGAPGTLTPSSTSQAITPSSTSAAVAWPPTAAAQTPTPGQPPVPRLQQFWGAAAPLQIPLLSLTNVDAPRINPVS